jgi:hypothetical protein
MTKNGKPSMYVQLKKALYGTLLEGPIEKIDHVGFQDQPL